ncbi:peptidase S9 [Bacteroidia bacterium]|nr:peptidase S9 [Bacteroidia bacterium]
MNTKLFISFLLLIVSGNTFSQKKQSLPQIYAAPPVTVVQPFKVDSLNLKGEKFSEKDMLKMSLSIPGREVFVRPLKADTAGYFFPEKPADKNTTIQLFAFNVSTDRYAKGTLKVTTPNMMEIYVDGKLAATKATEEKTFRNDKKSVTASLTPYPEQSQVVIKMIVTGKDEPITTLKEDVPPTFKVEIENEKNDSLTVFSFSNSDKRLVNFTDMMLGKRVTNIRISPEGQYILISYRNTFGEKGSSTTELYNIKAKSSVLIDTDGAKRQLSWMPKSEKLFYISKTEEGVNLITIDPATMQESTLAKNIPDQYIQIAPNERVLFYSKQEKGEESKSDLKLLKSPEDRQPGYTNRSFIHKYDLVSGFSQQLTFGSHSTWLSDISPDSKQILISFSDEVITERPFRKSTLLKLDLATMKADTLWIDQSFAGGASFSPDGKKLLVSGSGEAFNGIGLNIGEGQISNTYNTLSFIMDLSTKQIEAITKNFDPSIDAGVWNRKDNLIYFRTTDMDYVNVYSYNPSNKTFTKLPLHEDVIRVFDLANNAETGVYMGVGQSNSTRAYIYDLKSKTSTLIADPYNDRLSKMELGKVQDWNFTNSDGVEIKGRFYLPPNFDAAKKYPMIVYYYGGTTPTARTFEHPYPGHVFAAQGYVVYVVQPSGATGFGQKFAAMHVNAWGKRTAEDIIEGTKLFMKEHPYVNDKKIGCIGASYGGFMTMYLQTQTDMFAAAVSHAGISSISSYWGEGYWGYTYSSGASANSYPWNNPDLYVKQSPLFNADKIKTPILLTHGTVDTNVPIGESIQMYTALKILGKPVEFIQVKDENHGVANYKRRVEWNNSIMAWFDKWLKDDNGWWKALFPDSK